jgi:hypothetical protein
MVAVRLSSAAQQFPNDVKLYLWRRNFEAAIIERYRHLESSVEEA